MIEGKGVEWKVRDMETGHSAQIAQPAGEVGRDVEVIDGGVGTGARGYRKWGLIDDLGWRMIRSL
jgi:hypothetical protein